MRSWVNIFLLVAVIVGSRLASAQQPQTAATQYYEIAGVAVDGNRNVDARTILNAAALRPGDRISTTSEKLQLAIHRLYELNVFSHIDIVATTVVDTTITLTIRVQEFPRLKSLVITGCDDVSESDLKKKISLYPGDVVTDNILARIKRDALALCAEEGHLQATVEPIMSAADTSGGKVAVVPHPRKKDPFEDSIPGIDNGMKRGSSRKHRESPDTAREWGVGRNDSVSGTVAVLIKITEGPSVKIGTISFVGNQAFDNDKLKGQLEDTKEKSWYQFWRTSKLDKKKLKDDLKKLIDFYHASGFLDARVEHDTLLFADNNTRVNILITVAEGHRFYLRNITVSGNTAYPTTEILRRLNMFRGDVYNTEKFERNLRSNEENSDVSSLYYDNGYLGFQIEKEESRVGNDSVDITLHVVEHNQYRLREVNVVGNTKTYDKVVRRELYTLPGDYFSRAAIIRSMRQLSVLNFFNPEKIHPDTHMVDNTRVDVTYHVEEKSSDTFNASVGYSGSFGVTASIGLTFNNFSAATFLSDPFKYGAGQVLNITYERSATASSLNTINISFTEPWMWDTPTSLGFSLFDTKQIYTNYESSRYGASVSVGRRLRVPDDFFRVDYSMTAQQNNVSLSNGYYRSGITDQLTLTQVISRSSIDNAIFPTTGSRVSWMFQVNVPFDSDWVGFHKNKLTFEFFTPLAKIGGQNRLVLYTIADYGFMKEWRAGNAVNLIDFFFMGGNGLTGIPTIPLRGYADQMVGPQSPSNQALGGRIYEKYGMEIRYAVAMDPIPIYLLAFAEAGNVWNDLNSVDPFGLKRSVGLGARLMINPIGLLGFDEGYGFDPTVPGGPISGWNFHFQFGRGF